MSDSGSALPASVIPKQLVFANLGGDILPGCRVPSRLLGGVNSTAGNFNIAESDLRRVLGKRAGRAGKGATIPPCLVALYRFGTDGEADASNLEIVTPGEEFDLANLRASAEGVHFYWALKAEMAYVDLGRGHRPDGGGALGLVRRDGVWDPAAAIVEAYLKFFTLSPEDFPGWCYYKIDLPNQHGGVDFGELAQDLMRASEHILGRWVNREQLVGHFLFGILSYC